MSLERKILCARCRREVFVAVRVVALNKAWHRFCFSCVVCRKLLDITIYKSLEGELFCDSCYLFANRLGTENFKNAVFENCQQCSLASKNNSASIEQTENVYIYKSPPQSNSGTLRTLSQDVNVFYRPISLYVNLHDRESQTNHSVLLERLDKGYIEVRNKSCQTNNSYTFKPETEIILPKNSLPQIEGYIIAKNQGTQTLNSGIIKNKSMEKLKTANNNEEPSKTSTTPDSLKSFIRNNSDSEQNSLKNTSFNAEISNKINEELNGCFCDDRRNKILNNKESLRSCECLAKKITNSIVNYNNSVTDKQWYHKENDKNGKPAYHVISSTQNSPFNQVSSNKTDPNKISCKCFLFNNVNDGICGCNSVNNTNFLVSPSKGKNLTKNSVEIKYIRKECPKTCGCGCMCHQINNNGPDNSLDNHGSSLTCTPRGVSSYYNRKFRNDYCDRLIEPIKEISCANSCNILCRRCNRKVFVAEKILMSGFIYHDCCFTCFICRRHLDSLSVVTHKTEIFCKQCYQKYFGPQMYGYRMPSHTTNL